MPDPTGGEGRPPSVQAPPEPRETDNQPSPAEADSPQPDSETPPNGPPTKQDAPSGAAGRRDAPPKAKPLRPTAIVRYGLMRSIGEFRHNLDPPPRRHVKVVIRTERGVELGEVVTPVCKDAAQGEACGGCLTAEQLGKFSQTNGPEWPFRRDGRVLRPANPQDVIDYRHLQQSAREAGAFCRQQIKELNLEMRLVTVEHLLGGERIVFYFSAEHRVDFRELVRRLAGQYRTRIEMRQVGARDEARLVADYERCGQQCCCQSFLKYLKPVSMRMAKTQKATLDPSKISGRCGRLMCCLRYEDATYEQLRKKLPRRNTWVKTDSLVGRVVDTQILTQLVCIQLPDATRTAVSVEEIVERDLPAPAPPETPPATASHSRARSRPRPATRPPRSKARPNAQPAKAKARPPDEAPQAPPAEQAPAEGEAPGPKKRRRRRRSRRKKTGDAPAEVSASADAAAEKPPPPAAQAEAGPAKTPPKRRPHRRRKKRRPK